MRTLLRGVFPLFLLLPWPAGCSEQMPALGKSPIVRVRLLAGQTQVALSATAPPVVKSSGQRDPQRLELARNQQALVTLSQGGWRIGNAAFPPGELSLQPAAVGSVRINGQAYRGSFRFVPVASDRFDVVNDLDIDSYLMGVLSKEILPGWHLEAYKAQAIAARTYGLYEARTSPAGRHFDLYNDEKSQVYGGLTAETSKSRAAVLETAGIVLAWGPAGQEKIFKAYFSSCCGGVGQSAYDAFGDPDILPLREKYVGNLCSASPRFNWGPVVLSKQELTRRIRAWGARHNRPEKDISEVVRIDIAAVNRYNRPVRFYLFDARGLRYSLSGEELRWACNAEANGGPVLFSSYFKPISVGQTIQFVDGHGWGHGVGMCQWCAQARALQGYRHEDILRLAYPGAVLVRAY